MADASIEQQIIARLSRLDETQKRMVLDFMNHTLDEPQTFTAEEIIGLPGDERARLVAEAFAAAADEDFETFEAYTEEEPDA